MRKFKDILFMGNEKCSESCEKLRSMLNKSLDTLNYLQQPTHSTSKKEALSEEKRSKRYNKEIENTVRDIAMALTGKEIVFKDLIE